MICVCVWECIHAWWSMCTEGPMHIYTAACILLFVHIMFICVCKWHKNHTLFPWTAWLYPFSPAEAHLSRPRQLPHKFQHTFHSFLLIQCLNVIPLRCNLNTYSWLCRTHYSRKSKELWSETSPSPAVDFGPCHIVWRKWPTSFSKHPCGWLWGQGSGPDW